MLGNLVGMEIDQNAGHAHAALLCRLLDTSHCLGIAL